jgi:hypothetical protein
MLLLRWTQAARQMLRRKIFWGEKDPLLTLYILSVVLRCEAVVEK